MHTITIKYLLYISLKNIFDFGSDFIISSDLTGLSFAINRYPTIARPHPPPLALHLKPRPLSNSHHIPLNIINALRPQVHAVLHHALYRLPDWARDRLLVGGGGAAPGGLVLLWLLLVHLRPFLLILL